MAGYTPYFRASYRRNPIFYPSLPEGTLLASNGSGGIQSGGGGANVIAPNRLVASNEEGLLESKDDAIVNEDGSLTIDNYVTINGSNESPGSLIVVGATAIVDGSISVSTTDNTETLAVFRNGAGLQGASVGLNSSGDMGINNFNSGKAMTVFAPTTISFRTISNTSDNNQFIVGPYSVSTNQWESLDVVHVGHRTNFNNGTTLRNVPPGNTGFSNYPQITNSFATTQHAVFQTILNLAPNDYAGVGGSTFNVDISTAGLSGLKFDQIISIQCSSQLIETFTPNLLMVPYTNDTGRIRPCLPYFFDNSGIVAGECVYNGASREATESRVILHFRARRTASANDRMRIIVNVVYAKAFTPPV